MGRWGSLEAPGAAECGQQNQQHQQQQHHHHQQQQQQPPQPHSTRFGLAEQASAASGAWSRLASKADKPHKVAESRRNYEAVINTCRCDILLLHDTVDLLQQSVLACLANLHPPYAQRAAEAELTVNEVGLAW